MKKADFILLSICLLLGVIGIIALLMSRRSGTNVTVVAEGELVGQYDISTDCEVMIETSNDGVNLMRIQDGKVSIVYANCPNGDCVAHKEIAFSNESIICMPHKVVITIVSDEENGQLDGMVY